MPPPPSPPSPPPPLQSNVHSSERRVAVPPSPPAEETFHDARNSFDSPRSRSACHEAVTAAARLHSLSLHPNGQSNKQSSSNQTKAPILDAIDMERIRATGRPLAIPSTYTCVRNMQTESAPEAELSILKLAKEILGSVKAGADVTNVNLPASILDPVSTLEKATKSMQCGDLVPDIIFSRTPIQRMLGVLRFTLSGLAKEKFGKKPYNPVLGEIFRCAFVHRNEQHGNTVLVAEQVNHHPPITALHLYNRTLGFKMNSFTAPEPRFWGNSLDVKLKGSIRITLERWDSEEYVLTRPCIHMSGFFAGRQRLEFSGPAGIRCEATGLGADLEFRAKGMLGRGEPHAVSGHVFELATRQILYTFDGFWDGIVSITDEATKRTEVLMNYEEVKKAKSLVPILPEPSEHEDSFSTDIWAECTDAIWRGHTADANAAKRRVEDHERALRKTRSVHNIEWCHHYFQKRNDGKEGFVLRDGLENIIGPHIRLSPDALADLRQHQTDSVVAAPPSPASSSSGIHSSASAKSALAMQSVSTHSTPKSGRRRLAGLARGRFASSGNA